MSCQPFERISEQDRERVLSGNSPASKAPSLIQGLAETRHPTDLTGSVHALIKRGCGRRKADSGRIVGYSEVEVPSGDLN